MDKFVLLRFPDGSLSVQPVSFIKDYDPITQHNSKTWPKYSGPTQQNNWAKVIWPRAAGTTQVLAAQIVKFGPVRSNLDDLLNKMLMESAEDFTKSKGGKKSGKRRAVTTEDRILQRLRIELPEKATPESAEQGPSSGTGDTDAQTEVWVLKAEDGGAETRAAKSEARAAELEARASKAEARVAKAEARAAKAEAEARAAEAEARAAVAEARAAEAEARAAGAEARAADAEARAAEAEAKAVTAEATAACAEERAKLLEAEVEDAENKAVTAQTKALFALDSLYPLLQGLPGFLEEIRSRATAGAAQECGPPVNFGTVTVPSTRMMRLTNTPSVYTQELAEVVFGQHTLATSCLTGSTAGSGKDALDKKAVEDIIVHVMSKFKGTTASDVKSYLRRKCSNVAFALKKSVGG